MPLFRCCRPKLTNCKPSNSDLDTSGSCLRNLIALERRIQENHDENANDTAKHQQQQLIKILLKNENSCTNRSLSYFQKFSKKSPSDDQHRSNNKDDDRQTKSNCDFEFINLRFWETFGFIGIAMVVGLRSRLCEFAHYRRDRTTDNSASDQSFILATSSCPSCSFHNYCISSFNCGPSCQWYRFMFNKLVGSFHSIQPILRIVEDGQSKSKNIIEINNNHINPDPNPGVKDEKDHHPHQIPAANILDEDDDLLVVFQKAQTSSSCIKREQNNYHQISIGKDQGSDFSIDESISSSSHSSSSSCISASTSEISEAESDQNNDDDNDDLGAFLSKTLIEYCDHVNNLNAIEMMTNHRPEEAMKLWSNCRETSSTPLFNMGVAYESGRYATNNKTATLQNYCGKPDMDLAYYYYAMAAMKGHPNAIYNLALFHLYGKGRIKQNIERGVQILRLASKQGVGKAEKFLRKFDENSEKLRANFLHSSQQQQTWNLANNDWREIPSKTASSLSWMFAEKNRSKSEPNLNTVCFNHGHNQLRFQNIFT